MYVTAHRVRSRQGQVGINVFLHHHGGETSVDIDWDDVAIGFVADQATGALVSETTEIAPGGNNVLSYLDVVCPDGTSAEKIQQAIDFLQNELVDDPTRPLERCRDGVAVRFGAIYGLRGSAERIECGLLAQKTVGIVRRPVEPTWRQKKPFQIDAEFEEETCTFRISEHDRDRVKDAKEVSLPLEVVRVDLDTWDAFEAQHGDLMMHILPTVVGLPLEQLREEGGVIIVRSDTGRTLWEWPRRQNCA